MRFCLVCRRLSSDTPLCSNCGRSFGGRLCNHKKGRHLNPSAANVCGTCGSTVLTDAAASIPITGAVRLLAWGLLLGGITWAAPSAMQWIGNATGYSHYRDGRVWLIETVARLLLPFLIVFIFLYALSHMVPGEGGKLIRTALLGTTMWVVRGLLNLAESISKKLGQLAAQLARGNKTRR